MFFPSPLKNLFDSAFESLVNQVKKKKDKQAA